MLARLAGDGREHLGEAAEILDGLVLDEGFAPFLTLRAGRAPAIARRAAPSWASSTPCTSIAASRGCPPRSRRSSSRCSTRCSPDPLSLGPGVIFPIVAVLALIPLTIADGLGRGHPAYRMLALGLLGLTVAANGTSIALLVRELLARTSEMSGRELLLGALLVWLSNLIVFALWFWELDRGGPRAPRAPRGEPPDFLFPQMTDAKELMPGWQPAFSDYLYTVEHERDGLQPDRHDAHHGHGQAADVGPVALVVRARRARDRARREHPQLSILRGYACTVSGSNSLVRRE